MGGRFASIVPAQACPGRAFPEPQAAALEGRGVGVSGRPSPIRAPGFGVALTPRGVGGVGWRRTRPSPPHPVVPRWPSAPSWGPRLHLPGLLSPTRLLAHPPQDPPIATCPAKAPPRAPARLASHHTHFRAGGHPTQPTRCSVLAAGVEAPGHDLAPGVPGSTRVVGKCLSVDGSATGPVAGGGTQ